MKVIKNYLYNMGYQLLLMLVPLITVPYVSRVLGSYCSGINSYTNSCVTFFYLLGQLGITLYGNREIAYYRNSKYKRSIVFWEIEFLQICTSLISLILYIFFVLFFCKRFKVFFALQSFWIVSTGLDISWYFMGMEDFKKTVTKNALVKIISIILIFLTVKNKNDLGKYILLIGVAQRAGSVTLWPYLRNSVNLIRLKLLHPLRHFLPTVQLFIPTITTQVYLVVNRLMLGQMSTQSALGEFDYSDKIVKLVLSVVTATGTVMLSHVANNYAKGKIDAVRSSLYNSFDFVSAIAMPMMFGLMAIAKQFAPWFLGNQYKLTGILIIFEAPAIIFIAWSSVIGNQYLTPVNKVREFTLSVSAGALTNVLANFILIALFGAIGAAVATVISEIVTTSMQLHYINKTISRRKLLRSSMYYLIDGLIMFVVVQFYSNKFSTNLINLSIEVCIGTFIYILFLLIFNAPILKQAKKLYKDYIEK